MTNLNLNTLRNTFLAIVVAIFFSAQALASEIVYYPYNPSFGGSPLNGSVLLNSALATSKHKPPDIDSDKYGIEEKSTLDTFKDNLERSILSRLASAATSKMFDAEGNFVPGTYDTQNFTITITDVGDGTITIHTLDKATGDFTTFQVGK